MASQFVDLHCHSTASDGTLTPVEVVELAKRNGLSALSLTDHDTVAGIPEAMLEAEHLGIDFLPGIEISCEYPPPGTLHLLGYGVDPHSQVLANLTHQLIEARDNRNPKIIKRLNELGISITMHEVQAEAGGAVVGRPHIAAVLLKKGRVDSIKQAFDKYLGNGGLAYFDKERLTPRRALELVQQSGGIPVLAHPAQLRTGNDAELMRVIKDLADLGLEGIEVLHSDHDDALVEKYTRIAKQLKLLRTGGSDFHGGNKNGIELGYVRGQRVPREFFAGLIARHKELVKV